MDEVKISLPNIIVINFKPERSNKDRMLCKSARFYLDIDNQHLHIISDCGNYDYILRNGDINPFLLLLSHETEDTFLERISSRNVLDSVATWIEVKKYIDTTIEGHGIGPETHMHKKAYASCFAADTEDELIRSLTADFEYTLAHICGDAGVRMIKDCISYKFPEEAIHIAKIYIKYIKPIIVKLNDSEILVKLISAPRILSADLANSSDFTHRGTLKLGGQHE